MSEEKKEDSFLKYLKINKESINDNLKNQATLIYQFGLKGLKFDEALDKLELKLDTTMAKLASQNRAKYKSLKNGLSETHVKDLVNASEEVIALKEQILEMKHYLKLAKLRNKALDIKGENLINYAHNIREELRSNNKPLKTKE